MQAIESLDQNGTAVLCPAQTKPIRSWRTWLIGQPLPNEAAPNQAIGKLVGLAVFASDAMSSTAYATEEMMIALAAGGAAAMAYAFPLSLVIVAFLAILTLSYEQTIHAYPGGGGAYIVARDNLGEAPAQTAGAALLTDYILTVAVSIAAGVAQVTSAFPALDPYRVALAVGLVLLVMVVNLRGVKESGATFAIPSYFFLVMMFLTVGIGVVRYLTGNLGQVTDPPSLELIHGTQAVSLFLILSAFSRGTTALTGVEAVSNGIMAFREPRSRNAGITLAWMAGILGTLLLGITFLAGHISAVPSADETIISQLTRTVYGGRGPLYLATIASTTLILIMAANTSYADFPRLSALAAADGFLPRQLTYRGSRLVYSRGIVALGLIASGLIVAFHASVTALIPLYAIGVFLSFTLSQSGMARRWWRCGHLKEGEEIVDPGSTLRPERGWRTKMAMNGLGAVATFVVMIVFAVTKFHDGAWVIIFLIPTLVLIFFQIHRHYQGLAKRLSLEEFVMEPPVRRHRVILAISGVHRGTVQALRYAELLSDDLTAVHVAMDEAEAEKVRRKWELWGEGTRLTIVPSPYRTMLEPLLAYIEGLLAERQPGEAVTVVVPQFVPKHWWNNLLHMQTATFLRLALMFRPGIVITSVPYQVE